MQGGTRVPGPCLALEQGAAAEQVPPTHLTWCAAQGTFFSPPLKNAAHHVVGLVVWLVLSPILGPAGSNAPDPRASIPQIECCSLMILPSW